jgi:outer membrane protein assembly factor BamB
MTVIPLHPRAASHLSVVPASTSSSGALPTRGPSTPGLESAPPSTPAALATLETLLYGTTTIGAELPPLADLVGALLALADAQRTKTLLPLSGVPAEVAIVRRGASALVSLYHTDASPDVLVLDRRVPLRALLDASVVALEHELEGETDARAASIGARLVARAAECEIAPASDAGLSATRRTGGSQEDPGERHPLAFGFEAAIFASEGGVQGAVSHADVHAMLFGGQLWSWVRGRRIPLARGPILLVVQRMVSAVRALVDASDEGRALHVRLRRGAFVIAVRREKSGEVALTLGSDEDGVVTIPALDDRRASLPILRLAADLLRALVSVDRAQARNLRIRGLLSEVRRLRRAIASAPPPSFVNEDPDRLRSAATRERTGPGTTAAPAAHLRFGVRWTVALDGLDAPSTFLCGDRLVVATERRVVALDRDRGEVLWQHEAPSAGAFLAGTNVVRVRSDGVVEMREVHTGEVVIRTKLAPRMSGAPLGLYAGGQSSIPPTAIVCEGRDRLAAIDLRTGELRWRFQSRGAGAFRLRREGRVLLVVGGDPTVHAIDVVTGEVCWRWVGSGRHCLTPIAIGETAIVVSGEPGRGDATLIGLDLFSGTERFQTPLGAPIAAAPTAANGRVLVATTGPRRGALGLYDSETGEAVFSVADPGVGTGGGVLALDRALLVNAPDGKLTALDVSNGATRWVTALASSVSDDVPRKLTPVLRSGALFVPQATVHVVRPSDGKPIGSPLPSDLVPDALLVDERGWVFVGEESGHIAALAPEARLVLVKG